MDDPGCFTAEEINATLYEMLEKEVPHAYQIPTVHCDKFFHTTVYGCEEDARDAAQKRTSGPRRGDVVAVKFLGYDEKNHTKKSNALFVRLEAARRKEDEYKKKNGLDKMKIAFISCKNCKSRLNREFLVKREKKSCPVCGESLLSETIQAGMRAKANAVKKLEKEYTAAICRKMKEKILVYGSVYVG